jgi:serine/threonine-protein kinase RIO1
MSNITFNVPDDVLQEARVYAAENRTTVNAIVRAYLVNISNRRKRRKEAMSELYDMSLKSESDLGPDFKFDRASLYER